MYNGIGLQTARGSGTNGYVQTNRFLVKPRLSKVVTDSSSSSAFEGTAGLSRKANKEILEHDRKRQIQLKLLVLEEKLMDQGYTDSEIADKMDEMRRGLEAEAAADALEDGEVGPTLVSDSKISDTQTHQIAARKERQMETLRAALGIGVESQNKHPAMLPSDSEDSNNEDEPANNRKKDGNSKKTLKGVVDNTSELRNVKKSHENESAEDTFNELSRYNKQKSGRGHRDDSSDSDEKVKVYKKKTQRKTSSDSDDKVADTKKKKKPSHKSRSTRKRHDSDSSDTGSDTDSSSDSDSYSDGSRDHGRSLKKGGYHKKDVKEAMKKPRKTSNSSESDQSDDDKKKKISSKRYSRSKRHDSDSSSSEYDSDSSNDSDVHGKNDRRHGKSGKNDLEMKSLKDSHRRSDRDLGKEKAHGDDEKAQHARDSDGLDTLGNIEKLYQAKEEKMVKSDRLGKEPNISKRKMDEGNWDEQHDRKSKRRDMRDLKYNDEVKHSVVGKLHTENQINDRWGAEPARDYDVARRESGEGRERQGRKHRRDEDEDTRRISDRDGEQQQPERSRREQDDRKSSKYDMDRDHDTTKRARYDDSRSGRRYDEDDDRHGRKHSDGRHDDRPSRR